MGEYSREDLAAQDAFLRTGLNASRLRTLLLLLAGTFLLLYSTKELLKTEAVLLRYNISLSIAPNVLAWMLWGTREYLSILRSARRDLVDEVSGDRFWHDRLQLARFQLWGQKRTEAMVASLTSLEVLGLVTGLFAVSGW